MKRLSKVEEDSKKIEDIKILLDRISNASDELKTAYFCLFDNLNALYDAYPNLYKQFEMVVKLPNNEDAKDIVQLNQDIDRIMNNLSDEEYLKTYL